MIAAIAVPFYLTRVLLKPRVSLKDQEQTRGFHKMGWTLVLCLLDRKPASRRGNAFALYPT